MERKTEKKNMKHDRNQATRMIGLFALRVVFGDLGLGRSLWFGLGQKPQS